MGRETHREISAMSMTKEELAELLLTALYDMAESTPHPYFLFSMNELVPRLSGVDMAQIREALYLLESQGLVYIASMDSWGNISAMITPDGCAFVERGGETGIVERYRKDPTSFITETPRPSLSFSRAHHWSIHRNRQRLRPRPNVSGDVFEAMLGEMAEALRHESGLEPSKREDLLSDVQALKLQLGKQTSIAQWSWVAGRSLGDPIASSPRTTLPPPLREQGRHITDCYLVLPLTSNLVPFASRVFSSPSATGI